MASGSSSSERRGLGRFGQLVVGPPGSGKSTYCAALAQHLGALGRPTAVINLDPAAEGTPPYFGDKEGEEEGPGPCPGGDVRDVLGTWATAQQEAQLGPNGAQLLLMEILATRHCDWLDKLLDELEDKYVIFDCPGQVELFTVENSLKHIVEHLTREREWRLTAVHLVDAHLCSDPFRFLSGTLVSLTAMLQLELPHVNVLSKMDLIERFGTVPFGLEFYLECGSLERLADLTETDAADSAFSRRYSKLTRSLCEVVDSFSLVSFTPLCITDPMTLHEVLRIADKCNGYGLLEREVEEISKSRGNAEGGKDEDGGTGERSAGPLAAGSKEDGNYALRMADLYSKYMSQE